ncbi:glycosyltransferase family 4 protein [Streptomyces phytophilus]|uniref:glycosyltransferase family 4 protein n=1 Tax=Streptomyces phytophilus TaxID=722715 RepID=UPI0015EFE056|nr:glycosyltransferase family 4 protein [Streptomyces phytophilus]
MRISFLISNAYAVGGTVRTTFTLARTLAEQHDVEIVSVFRREDEPFFDAGPRVPVRALLDARPGSPGSAADHPDHALPARHYPPADGRYDQYSALTDRLLAEHLRHLGADAVVGTRPGLNVAVARHTRRGVLRLGQEHLTFATHPRQLRVALSAAYPRLHAVVTMTEADARAYRAHLRLPGVAVTAIPNGVPAPDVPPSDNTARCVVAAGRLAPLKHFDHLVKAFDRVADAHPDWQLRIYGTGPRHDALRAQIDRLGLYNHVFLMGAVHPMEPEWPKGSIAAHTSALESFGLSIAEAMRGGLPVVATDCPLGPREIIHDGEDGLLVPPRKPAAVARGLLRLIGDEDLRQEMGTAALANAARFDPARAAERYDDLFARLHAHRPTLPLTGTVLGGLYAHRTREGAEAA